jgi:hypothetical protein
LSRATWRPFAVERYDYSMCPSRYASIRTLGEPTLLGDSVHTMRSVFSDSKKALQSSERSLCPSLREWTKFVLRSRLTRPEAIGHAEAVHLALGPLRREHHLL